MATDWELAVEPFFLFLKMMFFEFIEKSFIDVIYC